MHVGMAHAIEAAESEYLCARVESLSRISGNPFGARVFFNEAFLCFQVKASPSPMHLILVVLDSAPPNCIFVDESKLSVAGKAYWYLPDEGVAETDNAHKIRIVIPKANRLGLGFVRSCYEQLGNDACVKQFIYWYESKRYSPGDRFARGTFCTAVFCCHYDEKLSRQFDGTQSFRSLYFGER